MIDIKDAYVIFLLVWMFCTVIYLVSGRWK